MCFVTRLLAVVETPDAEAELSSSDDSEPPDSPLDGSGRMYPLKPRPILQRRNTITGATPTTKRPYPSVEQVNNLNNNCSVDLYCYLLTSYILIRVIIILNVGVFYL